MLSNPSKFQTQKSNGWDYTLLVFQNFFFLVKLTKLLYQLQ